eukprot:COSAG03_NODE_1718_length_3605_cov_1.642613_5_plen_53_part_00
MKLTVGILRGAGGFCVDAQQTWQGLGQADDAGRQPHLHWSDRLGPSVCGGPN